MIGDAMKGVKGWGGGDWRVAMKARANNTVVRHDSIVSEPKDAVFGGGGGG